MTWRVGSHAGLAFTRRPGRLIVFAVMVEAHARHRPDASDICGRDKGSEDVAESGQSGLDPLALWVSEAFSLSGSLRTPTRDVFQIKGSSPRYSKPTQIAALGSLQRL